MDDFAWSKLIFSLDEGVVTAQVKVRMVLKVFVRVGLQGLRSCTLDLVILGYL